MLMFFVQSKAPLIKGYSKGLINKQLIRFFHLIKNMFCHKFVFSKIIKGCSGFRINVDISEYALFL